MPESILLVIENGDCSITMRFNGSLTDSGFKVTTATTLHEIQQRLSADFVDAVLLDLHLWPSDVDLSTLRQLRILCPHLPVVVLAAEDDIELGVEALRAGAQDFLPKEIEAKDLVRAVKYSMARCHKKGSSQSLQALEALLAD